MTDPRGIRNNNPLNLRPGVKQWQGEIASDGGYCVFSSPEYGLRAACKTLLTYQSAHNLHTIRAIISRWAPPSDNNPTDAYIDHVVSVVGVGPDDNVDLTDASVLSSFLIAMIQQEEGQQPYAVSLLERVASNAIGDGLEW